MTSSSWDALPQGSDQDMRPSQPYAVDVTVEQWLERAVNSKMS